MTQIGLRKICYVSNPAQKIYYFETRLSHLYLRCGGGSDIDLFQGQGPLNHGGEIQGTVLEANPVLILRLANLNSCLEGGFINSSKKIAHTSTRV